MGNIKNPTVEAFSKLTGIALPKKKSPASNKKFMEEAIDWLRNNEPNLEDVDDSTVEEVTKIAGVHMPRGVIPKAARKKPLEDAIDWIRKNDPIMDDLDEPVLES